jgi:hypothetical protein
VHDIRVGVVEEGGASEGGRTGRGDGIDLLAVTLALALVRLVVGDAVRVFSARSRHTWVGTVVYVHSRQGLSEDVERLVVDHHL